MFGLESPDALNVIGRYVEDRYNLEVKHTYHSLHQTTKTLKIDTRHHT